VKEDEDRPYVAIMQNLSSPFIVLLAWPFHLRTYHVIQASASRNQLLSHEDTFSRQAKGIHCSPLTGSKGQVPGRTRRTEIMNMSKPLT
jgi:hypothetical protein